MTVWRCELHSGLLQAPPCMIMFIRADSIEVAPQAVDAELKLIQVALSAGPLIEEPDNGVELAIGEAIRMSRYIPPQFP